LEEADLVVAGAYSHSRIREALFGGMTKSLLEQFSLPVFVSH
jgi:nucleotide-binding universal stress UspA family protein